MLQRYDSKAIVARAHHYQLGETLRPGDFSGGQQTVVRALATRMDFRVQELLDDWADDELILVLHWYLGHRPRTLRVSDPQTRALAKILEEYVAMAERPELRRFRAAADVLVQLQAFGSRDRERAGKRNQRVKDRHRRIWEAHADERNRARRVRAILDRLDAGRTRLAPGVGSGPSGHVVAEGPARGYGSRRGQRPKPTKPYQGPRKIPPRGRSAPRQEDPEKYDRSNQAHEDVRHALAMYLKAHGFEVEDPASADLNFDLAARRDALRLVMEVKSLHEGDSNAEPHRLGLGLGQVLWYRQRFAALYGERRVAVLAVEREPQQAEAWIEVCRSVQVVLTWPERNGLLVGACVDVQQGRW
ncbi:MAG: hypothetical protein KDK70_10085 [Myxococcales bacterium]|nr:hypothetical protein [Myxococcales bacterium]